MSYLKQSRGKGWVFRMKTPEILVGKPNPWTGKPFGNEIKKGLGTRSKREAMRLRDVALGEIRRLEVEAAGGKPFSKERALSWAAFQREFEARSEGTPYEITPSEVIRDEIEAELALPRSKRRSSNADLERYAAIALRGETPLTDALEQYLVERGPEAEQRGYMPLKPATVKDVKTAVAYLRDHLGPEATLAVVTTDTARVFLQDVLPSKTGPRSPQGLSAKTVDKHATMLAGLWDWARERGLISSEEDNPWRRKRSVRRAKGKERVRRPFNAEEVHRLFKAYPAGDRMGDAMRLALVTGARADELGQVRWADVEEDGSGFHIREGKTENAARWVPLPTIIRPVVLARRARMPASADGRLLWDWPLRPKDGKCSSLSQAFTRVRREVLGTATNGKLVFHSFRHTWRTQALRAGLNDHMVHQIGGWKATKTSSTPYNHGFEKTQLAKAMNTLQAQMATADLLEFF
ncbi:site-specific integrase [Rhodovulum sp. DZ06]|uniref:site-specific integrase n=1 Tax=Rhodovulum sp. DZ06 TaxID=3425126 RepID=UPI003D34D2FF